MDSSSTDAYYNYDAHRFRLGLSWRTDRTVAYGLRPTAYSFAYRPARPGWRECEHGADMRKKFSWKPFTSFFIASASSRCCCRGSCSTCPSRRIANWTHWQLGLAKEQWQAAAHRVRVFFIGAATLPPGVHWKVLWAYLRTRVHTGTSNRGEFAVASVAVIAVLALTLAEVPPLSTVMAVGERAKNSWVTSETEPPLPTRRGSRS